MFSNAKVGDRVWSFMCGWGTIREITSSKDYPLKLEFVDGLLDSFSAKGFRHKNDLFQTLFWDEIVYEVPKKPLPKLEVDTKVLVWDVDEPKNKLVRYFCSFDTSGRVVVFQHGTTSFSCEGYTEIWTEWEVYKEHESE